MTPRRDPPLLLQEQLTLLLQTAEQLATGLRQLLDHIAAETAPSSRGSPPAASGGAFCLNCDRRETCTTPCDEVAAVLPGVSAGRRQTANVPLGILSEDRRPRSWHEEWHEAFMAVRSELTPAQREVVSLVYGEAITQAEAAARLGRSPSTISEHIKKAKSRLGRSRERALARGHADDLVRVLGQLGRDPSAFKSDDPDPP
jgi:DNA-binding CsgD family transcriptional regulator